MITISSYKGNLAVTIYLRGHVYRTHVKHSYQIALALCAWSKNPELDFTQADAFYFADYFAAINLVCGI